MGAPSWRTSNLLEMPASVKAEIPKVDSVGSASERALRRPRTGYVDAAWLRTGKSGIFPSQETTENICSQMRKPPIGVMLSGVFLY